MKIVNWNYCKSPNDINKVIITPNEDWEGITADNIISITYDSNRHCYIVFWKYEE